jgi:hypothetical protein
VRQFRDGRLLGPLVVALGLLAVIAVASRDPLSAFGKRAGPVAGGVQIDASPWEFALLAVGGLIGFVCILIYGRWARRSPIGGRLPHFLLRLALTLLTALVIAAALAGLHRRAAPRRPSAGALTSARAGATHASLFTIPAGVSWAIVGTLVAAVMLAVLAASIRPRRSKQEALPSAVESAVTAALVDLDRIADPRLAIIAAYRRMEHCLAEAGFPRAAPEAPREYLGRVASTLELDPKPLATLTTLFETAKFSLRELDATARERAISALHVLRAQLA